jgi:large subunit ribosomal protein L18
VFSALKGILDAGVDVPHGEEILPEEDRHLGAHIDEAIPSMTEEVRDTIEEGSA